MRKEEAADSSAMSLADHPDIFQLRFDAGECEALGLGFNHSDCLGVSVKHVVGIARGQRKFTHGNAQPRRDVHLAVVLHDPASLFKLAVDLLPGLLFGCHALPSV